MQKELLLTNGYDIYKKELNGDLTYMENLTKEQALELVNAKQFNYNKKELYDLRFKLVHQNDTYAIFKE